MNEGTGLKRVLTFQDLVLFGVASIMGSGGFNLIGDGIISGGSQFPVALAAVSALFQGTSYVYQEAYNEFKTNTAESDLIKQEFGQLTASAASTTILLFGLISVSVILVICSKLLFPTGTWSGQISFALVLLSMMTTTSLQGIEFNRDIITLSGLAVTGLLAFATLVGIIELREGVPAMPAAIKVAPNLIHSILYFYFVLAGFDALIKFTEEAADPDHDLARSFYGANALSTLLTTGVCLAFLVVFSTHSFKENDNIVAKIIGTMLGPQAEQFTGLLSIALMVITGFVSFLASTRYIFSLSQEIKGLDIFTKLNEKKAPWKAILIATAIIALGILNNHVYTLVKVCDATLTVTLLLVSAAAAKLAISRGKTPWIEGLTTLGLGGLLSISTLYR